MAMAMAVGVQALVLAAPFVNVLVWLGGAHWLGAYAVTAALAMDAVAVSVVLTVALFRLIGPRRTRFVAQIVAAIIGAAFVIGVQFAAIFSFGTMSRAAALQSAALPSSRRTSAASCGGRPAPSLAESWRACGPGGPQHHGDGRHDRPLRAAFRAVRPGRRRRRPGYDPAPPPAGAVP